MLTEKILQEANRISKKRLEAKEAEVDEIVRKIAGEKPPEAKVEDILLEVVKLFDFLKLRKVSIANNSDGTIECKIAYGECTKPISIIGLDIPQELREAVEKIEQKHCDLSWRFLSMAQQLKEFGFSARFTINPDAVVITSYCEYNYFPV